MSTLHLSQFLGKIIAGIVICMALASVAQAEVYEEGSCSAGNFSISFSNATFTAGIGWSSGSGRNISFSGSCSGCSWGPGVYGWYRTPLVEYYIGKSGGSSQGSYSCNGRSYTLYVDRRYGQPSIDGTSDFDQYNCSGSRSSPVDMGCHFNAWRNLGRSIGSHDYQIVSVEGFSGNSGNASVSVSGSNWYQLWVNGGSATFNCGGGGSTTTTAAGTTTTTSWGTTTSTTSGGGGGGSTDCSNIQVWSASTTYSQAGTRVQYNCNMYKNNWYSKNQNPEQNSGQWQAWTLVGACQSGTCDGGGGGSTTTTAAGTTTTTSWGTTTTTTTSGYTTTTASSWWGGGWW